MGILAWIVLGAIAGFITNLIMGGGEGVIATVPGVGYRFIPTVSSTGWGGAPGAGERSRTN